jgi:hypothetical protein
MITPDGDRAWVTGPSFPADCARDGNLMAKVLSTLPEMGPVQEIKIGSRDELLPMLAHVWFCGRDEATMEEDYMSPGPDGVNGIYICAGPNSQYQPH